MLEAIALTRARWLTFTSYRMRLVLALGGLAATIMPVYYIAGALQPVMGNAIAADGGNAFAFLVVGLAAMTLVSAAVDTLPSEVDRAVTTGTLEALLASPTSMARLLAGLAGFGVTWSAIKALMLLGAGWLLGADIALHRLAAGLLILALTAAAHLPFGVISVALVLAFRTTGPLPGGIMGASALLGGVYYPTHVIPAWIQTLSGWLPMTYGVRALRRTILEGATTQGVMYDVLVLVGFTLGLGALAALCLRLSLAYARRAGTFAQY